MPKLKVDNRDKKLQIFKPSKDVAVLWKESMYIGTVMYLKNCKSWMLIDMNTKNIAMSANVLTTISQLLNDLNTGE